MTASSLSGAAPRGSVGAAAGPLRQRVAASGSMISWGHVAFLVASSGGPRHHPLRRHYPGSGSDGRRPRMPPLSPELRAPVVPSLYSRSIRPVTGEWPRDGSGCEPHTRDTFAQTNAWAGWRSPGSYFVCEGRPGGADHPTPILQSRPFAVEPTIVQLAREGASHSARSWSPLPSHSGGRPPSTMRSFILNDPPGLVEPCGAHGVHVGHGRRPGRPGARRGRSRTRVIGLYDALPAGALAPL